MTPTRLAPARKTHRAAACLTAAIACICAACLCAGCTGAATHAADATPGGASGGPQGGASGVAASPDGRFAFVTLEDSQQAAEVNLGAAG